MSKPSVFVSYSHRDREWKDRLVHHLEVLEREGQLEVWEDNRIPASADWRVEIEGAIGRARVAVLLMSVDFLRSDFIRTKEVPEFLARRMAGGLHVFPVIIQPCAWEQVEALAAIQARPRDGKVLADFRRSRAERELVEIAREILQLVKASPPVSEATAPGPSPIVIPRQLPSPPADFVGRKEDLAELRRAIRKGGATICGLQGQGGVGKTALALVLAHEMAKDYPDGQIFLDLQGMSERPLSAADAMAHVARSFYPEATLPEGGRLAEAYRDALAEKQALLVMDNAAGRDQVVPLVPPPGCALLVTSRQRFTLPGLAVRDLELLPDTDARDLLLAITPRVSDRADEIARLCGYLPFALRIAAGTLVERPDLSVDAYEKRLGGEREKAAIGEKVLGLGLSLLPDDLERRYRHLAVFAGDFDAPAAGAVWELGEDETDDALGSLVRRSLLEGKDGRYRLHDLAQAFAVSRLTGEEKEQVELRHAEHYRGVLEEANHLYKNGNEHIVAGLALFDREWHQIAAGQAWAADKLQEREEAARLVSGYPHAGGYVLGLRLPPLQRIAWLEAGREGARRATDRAAEGRHLGNLGIAYASLGETRRAIEFHEQDLSIAREIGDRRGEGITLGNLGTAYADLGEIRRAVELYEAALGISREIGNRRAEGNALGNLGNAYAKLGDTRRAIEYYEQVRTISREIGDRYSEGISSWNLGLAYEKLGELSRAEELIQVRVDFERQLGLPGAEKYAAYLEALRARLVGG